MKSLAVSLFSEIWTFSMYTISYNPNPNAARMLRDRLCPRYCWPFAARSCSMICLLHLKWKQSASKHSWAMLVFIPPTWEESSLFREPRPRLPIRTNTPNHCRYAYDHSRHNRRICFPVRWLRVPSSCGRPHMLGVSITGLAMRISLETDIEPLPYGIFPPLLCATAAPFD